MRTVLVADGNTRLGQVIGQLLDDDHRYAVVGVVTTAEQALEQVARHRPDVVLVSARLEDGDGVELCAALRPTCPTAALLLWSHDADGAQRQRLDVDGTLERGMTYAELAQAVRHARPRSGPAHAVVDLAGPRRAGQVSEAHEARAHLRR